MFSMGFIDAVWVTSVFTGLAREKSIVFAALEVDPKGTSLDTCKFLTNYLCLKVLLQR